MGGTPRGLEKRQKSVTYYLKGPLLLSYNQRKKNVEKRLFLSSPKRWNYLFAISRRHSHLGTLSNHLSFIFIFGRILKQEKINKIRMFMLSRYIDV